MSKRKAESEAIGVSVEVVVQEFDAAGGYLAAVGYWREMVIADVHDLVEVGLFDERRLLAKRHKVAVENRRKDLLLPLREQIDGINAQALKLSGPLKAIEDHFRGCVVSAAAERQRILDIVSDGRRVILSGLGVGVHGIWVCGSLGDGRSISDVDAMALSDVDFELLVSGWVAWVEVLRVAAVEAARVAGVAARVAGVAARVEAAAIEAAAEAAAVAAALPIEDDLTRAWGSSDSSPGVGHPGPGPLPGPVLGVVLQGGPGRFDGGISPTAGGCEVSGVGYEEVDFGEVAVDFGEVAYRGYFDSASGLSLLGKALPAWGSLPEAGCGHWRAAAAAVVRQMEMELGINNE